MNLIAYGYQIDKQDHLTINKMAQFVNADQIKIIDLRSFQFPNTLDNDVFVWLFGRQAQDQFERSNLNNRSVSFPDITRLDPSLGNTTERQEAYEILLKIKNSNQQDIVPDSQQSVPINLLTQLGYSTLESMLEELYKNKVDYWQCITQDGKTVKISYDPNDRDADINMTFSELISTVLLVDMFNIKDIKIIYKEQKE